VIGVRQSQGTYHSVYRYALPSGQSCEATSNQGSGSLRGRATGASLPLLVIPEHPDEVQEARSHVCTLVGAVFLAIGAWLFYIAVTTWPVGPMTWVVAAALALYLGFKIRRIALPGEKRLGCTSGPTVLRQRKEPEIASHPLQHAEDILA
jgi:hypothetical protein